MQCLTSTARRVYDRRHGSRLTKNLLIGVAEIMNQNKRLNTFGGSAGGGGYDYQAEAYALVAAKILAQESLNWPETGCDRIPVSIRMETGSGGDDLQITLHSGKVIEIQAKRGLQRGNDLWDALLALATTVSTNSNTYGVLLTNTDGTSNTVRDELKNDIIKIGQGTTDNLHEIAEDFLKRLRDNNLDDVVSICSQMRIIIRDLDSGSQGEEETLETLRKVITEPQLAGAARSILVSDGLDLIKYRGRRDTSNLIGIIKQAGISLSSSTMNLAVRRAAFIEWSSRINGAFSIASLKLELPMSKAWIRLRGMDSEKATSSSKSLAEQIRNYHEWHRLADTSYSSDVFKIEAVARRNSPLVILGGPGSGKSTLLRRLTQVWSDEGLVILRVSLRTVALRMRKGELFDEAVLSVASEGFSSLDETQRRMLLDSSWLLADGLDETDSDRQMIADRLRNWVGANNNRRVVVTTRPVGYNPAWFEEWEHLELLPLGQSEIKEFASVIFDLLHSVDSKQALQTPDAFLKKLERSRTASIAARNPQLLGFLIALYINGYSIDGKRFGLYSNIVEAIRKRTDRDRPFQHHIDATIAKYVLNGLGWILLTNPVLPEDNVVEQLGAQLAANGLSSASLPGQQIASRALAFWEERGLIERLNAGAITTFTFVHMAFQEFAAARFLADLPEGKIAEWLRAKYNQPDVREVLLLTGATRQLLLVIKTLLEIDDPTDPVSIAALLAVDILAESEDPPSDLREQVFSHLIPRLTSTVPMVVYETGEKLRLLALSNPEIIGPVAMSLEKHKQHWTCEVACALGILAGPNYVDEEALLPVYSNANDSQIKISQPGINISHSDLIEDLLTHGAEYLLGKSGSAHGLDIVKQKYKEGECSVRVCRFLEDVLRPRLTPEEFRSLTQVDQAQIHWESMRRSFEAHHEGERAFLEAVQLASEKLEVFPEHVSADSRFDSLARLWDVFKISDSPASDLPLLRYRRLLDPLVEVICGAILAANLKPSQVRIDVIQSLQLGNSQTGFYTLIENSPNFQAGFKPDWLLAKKQGLAADLLIQALDHPSRFVCRFAAMLLWECFNIDQLRFALKPVLVNGKRYSLAIIARMASDLWQEEAPDLICDRLEQNLTKECIPLIKTLGETCGESTKPRAKTLLHNLLASREAKIVEATLYAIEKMGLDQTLATDIKNCYYWWYKEGPQDPEEGAVPDNVAAVLFSHLHARGKISFDEAREASRVKRSDLRDVAIKAICQVLAGREDLISQTFDEINSGKMSKNVLTELSRAYPSVCQRHINKFLKLLDSTNTSVQIACISALGDGWVPYSQIEGNLRSLLDAPDLDVRDETLETLRRLSIKRSV